MSFFNKIKSWFGEKEVKPIVRKSPHVITTTLYQPDPPTDITIRSLQAFLKVTVDGAFGPASKAALLAKFTNKNARALTDEDIELVAMRLGVKPAVIRAVQKVEAPRGAFDSAGRPTALFEKHIFGKRTQYKWNATHPDLSSVRWAPGTYGAASNQWNRIANACALNPKAAFEAASFGAYQVLGVNAVDLGYKSALHMALELTRSELAHLECFEKFVTANSLVDELRQCKAGVPSSCIPFVSKYNGPGFRKNDYHTKFATAIAFYD